MRLRLTWHTQHKGVNQRSKVITQTQQQRLERVSPGIQVNTKYINSTKSTSRTEFMHLVFTGMPGESYCRQLRSFLLCLYDIFWALINSLVCWFCMSALGLILLQILTWHSHPGERWRRGWGCSLGRSLPREGPLWRQCWGEPATIRNHDRLSPKLTSLHIPVFLMTGLVQN